MNRIINHQWWHQYLNIHGLQKKKKKIARKISYNKRIDLQSFPRLQLL